MFDRFCFLMRWLHQGSDCQMKKLMVLPGFPDLDQRFAGNLKEVGQMEPDTAPQARKKRFLGHFLGEIFLYWKRHENHPFGLKSDKKRQTTFSKFHRHLDPQNVKIWRFRHDLVTLPSFSKFPEQIQDWFLKRGSLTSVSRSSSHVFKGIFPFNSKVSVTS